MKEILKKIRNKRLKGNVSLLIIFILLASSVIALLSINQIQHLLTYGNMTFNYFRSFYIAKAWTELGLTEVYHREAGFKDSIKSWNAIITDNLVWIYSGFNPYFDMEIESNFGYLTDDVRYTSECDNGNKIVLWGWEWIMLSLFKDNTNWIDKILGEWSNLSSLWNEDILKLKMEKLEWSKNFMFWLFSYNDAWVMNDIIVKEWNDLRKFLSSYIGSVNWYRRYLTIKNKSLTQDSKFCISMDWMLIPYSNSLVSVKANYGDMEVGLQSVVEKEVPAWSLDVLWEEHS